MVSQALADGLLNRIQTWVARDINKRIPLPPADKLHEVQPDDIYIHSFSRVQNNWQAVASAKGATGYYVLSHNGSTNLTTAYIFIPATPPFQAIV